MCWYVQEPAKKLVQLEGRSKEKAKRKKSDCPPDHQSPLVMVKSLEEIQKMLSEGACHLTQVLKESSFKIPFQCSVILIDDSTFYSGSKSK